MNVAILNGEVMAIGEQYHPRRVMIEMVVRSRGKEQTIWVEARDAQAASCRTDVRVGDRIAVEGTVEPEIEADVLADRIKILVPMRAKERAS